MTASTAGVAPLRVRGETFAICEWKPIPNSAEMNVMHEVAQY